MVKKEDVSKTLDLSIKYPDNFIELTHEEAEELGIDEETETQTLTPNDFYVPDEHKE